MAEKLNEEFEKALKERIDLRMQLLRPEDKKHAPRILEGLKEYYADLASKAPEGSTPALLKASSKATPEQIREITDNNADFAESMLMKLDVITNQVKGMPSKEVKGLVSSVKGGDAPDFDYNNVSQQERDYIDMMIGAEVQQAKSTSPEDKKLSEADKYKIGFLYGNAGLDVEQADHKAAKDKLKQVIGGIDVEFEREVNSRRDSMAEEMREKMLARSQEPESKAPTDVGAPQQGIDSPRGK